MLSMWILPQTPHLCHTVATQPTKYQNYFLEKEQNALLKIVSLILKKEVYITIGDRPRLTK